MNVNGNGRDVVRHYYNEIDPKAAAWLRALITAKLIPEGTVDERSITEVQPADLVGYVQCHFFAGVGGWPQALRLAGWPASRRVWTGSCPCQPFSSAGKRKGKDDERHLWPVWFELLRGYNAISQREPVPVFGEQVASAIRHGWLDGVCTDLEGEGYTCGHAVLGAHSVGSPHIRQRLFWVANPQHNGSHGSERPGNIPPMEQLQRREEEQASVQQFTTSRNGSRLANSADSGRRENGDEHEQGRRAAQVPHDSAEHHSVSGLADTKSAGQRSGQSRGDCKCRLVMAGAESRSNSFNDGTTCRMANSISDGRGTRRREDGEHDGDELAASRSFERVEHTTDDSERARIQRDEEGTGSRRSVTGGSGGRVGNAQSDNERRAWEPGQGERREAGGSSSVIGVGLTHGSGRGQDNSQIEAGHSSPTSFWFHFDLIPCRDGKTRRVKSGVRCLAHGVSGRVAQLRGLGNAIVPQVAAEFIQAYMQTEHALAPSSPAACGG